MSISFLLTSLALFATSPAQASLASDSEADFLASIRSDSGFDGPPYEELVASLKQLAEQHPDRAETFTYGQSIEGRPLVGIRIQMLKNPGADAPLMVINGAIHGNEFLGIEDRLVAWILEAGASSAAFEKFFAQGGAVVVIPVMNPDGYAADDRGNARGTDLNRDFELRRTRHAPSKEKETQAYTAFLKNELSSSGRKLRFTLDYHCCIGALLVPWAYGIKVPMQPKDVSRFNVAKGYAKDILGTRSGTAYEVLGYTADGSTMDHFFETYGTLAVAFEGVYRREHLQLAKHAAFLEKVADALNEGRL